MNIRIDTHSHTLASGHAYNTLREMAAMAAEKGLEGLAVTEHAPEMPGSCQLYYFQNLRVVPRTLYNIHLFAGNRAEYHGPGGKCGSSPGRHPGSGYSHRQSAHALLQG